jgi:type IV pilus assembly protein PilN
MIRINLLAQAQQGKARSRALPKFEGTGAVGQNLLMVGVVVLALLAIGWRWYSLASEQRHLRAEIVKAEQERERLQAIIKKGEDYKAKKELLERKITLVTDLKKNQKGPVHLLDQVSRQLPDFLWLQSMNESGFKVQIKGSATTYNAVSDFYNNLTGSPFFDDVVLGPISSVSAGVSFSLSCQFVPPPVTGLETAPTAGSPATPPGT